MNLGKTIFELRKQKNVTQEDLATELGVTAAAVSKWENGYTLPDVLMLCSLADYFEVTADELLGRFSKHGLAVIAAQTKELGEKIKSLAAQYGIHTEQIYSNYQDAAAAVRCNSQITHLLIGFLGNELPALELDLGTRAISMYLSISNTEHGILSDLRNSLENNI